MDEIKRPVLKSLLYLQLDATFKNSSLGDNYNYSKVTGFKYAKTSFLISVMMFEAEKLKSLPKHCYVVKTKL